MDEQSMEIEVALSSEELAVEIEHILENQGAEDVRRLDQRGLFPVVPIVIVALLGLSGLAALVVWIIRSTRCQVILDARQDPIREEIDCRIRDGRLIVLTKDDTKVEIVEVPPIVDFTVVARAALTAGADAVRTAAEAAGAKVDKVTPLGTGV